MASLKKRIEASRAWRERRKRANAGRGRNEGWAWGVWMVVPYVDVVAKPISVGPAKLGTK